MDFSSLFQYAGIRLALLPMTIQQVKAAAANAPLFQQVSAMMPLGNG